MTFMYMTSFIVLSSLQLPILQWVLLYCTVYIIAIVFTVHNALFNFGTLKFSTFFYFRKTRR